jgi:5'-AMP-activated protein kinase catalytic alpha subunit
MPTFLNTSSGQYQLGRTLGSGVSCKVKLAKDDNGNRFAIKLIKGADYYELIQAELDTLKKVSHQHVIRLIEAGKGKQSNPKKKEDKEVNFIVLELASGGELFDFIAMGGRFSEEVGRHYSN